MDAQKRTLSGQHPAKKAKNCQKYRETYTAEFPCLRKSEISENMAFCVLCTKNFSISHGGRDDCRRHVLSKKHEECATAASKTRTVSSFFQTQNDETLSAVNAECLFARFLIEHNIPISAADHAKQLFTVMFPDSKIAKKYSSGHTKTTAMIKNMAQNTISEVLLAFGDDLPYSLSTDGSNDCNDIKHYPVLITYFDKDRGKIRTMLLALTESSDNTGEGIFNALKVVIEKKGLLWEKCIGFSSDNANTMMGKKKGVAAFLMNKNENVILRGCPCHLLHIAAKKATSAFFDSLEMLLLDIFFFLEKSSKRKSSLKLQQQLCGQKPHKILKYTSTRWLSLLNSINRVLEQWEPLKAFFSENANEENLQNKRFENVKSCLELSNTKLNLLFLNSVLPLFTNVNLLLQQEEPFIHKLRRTLEQLFMDLLVRFVKPNIIADDAVEFHLSNKNYKKRSKQKDDKELVIGAKARSYLSESNLCDETLSEFYSSVRKFYVEACAYVQEKLLSQDDFLKHAEVADIAIRMKTSFSSVLYMVKRFPFLVKDHDVDKLEVEFAAYQIDKFETLGENERIDKVWSEISKLRGLNGEIKYNILPKVMFAILTVPHSNAASERIFSIVRKNQTVFRPTLGTETLEALIIEQVNMSVTGEMCYSKKFTEKDLKSAKQCTLTSLSSV